MWGRKYQPSVIGQVLINQNMRFSLVYGGMSAVLILRSQGMYSVDIRLANSTTIGHVYKRRCLL